MVGLGQLAIACLCVPNLVLEISHPSTSQSLPCLASKLSQGYRSEDRTEEEMGSLEEKQDENVQNKQMIVIRYKYMGSHAPFFFPNYASGFTTL